MAPPGLSLGAKAAIGLMTSIGGAILIGALLLLVLPGRLLPLSTVSLPGLRIDVPIAPRESRGVRNYRAGRLIIRSPLQRLLVQVAWEPGKVFDDPEARYLMKAMSTALGPSVEAPVPLAFPAPAGLTARSWKMPMAGKPPMWITLLACGGRRMTVTTSGRAAGLEELHRRMLASFECRPEPAGEARLTDIPVVMELPEGWRRVQSSDEEEVVTDGSSTIIARAVGAQFQVETFDKVLPAILGGTLRVGARERDDWPVEGTLNGAYVTGWVAFRSCPESSLMLFAMHPREAERPHQLLRKVRCRRPDEAPQTWPPAGLPLPRFPQLHEPNLDVRKPKLRLLGKP
jgi:hypothetical protein